MSARLKETLPATSPLSMAMATGSLAEMLRVRLLSNACWAATAAFTRLSSLSALVATASASLWLFLFGSGQMALLLVILTLLIYQRHAANIARLRAGTEPKIGA